MSILGRRRWEEVAMAKSEYDPAKDILIKELEYVEIGDRQHACIAVWCYNGGDIKLGIQRKIGTRVGTVTKAIGRMTREEAKIIIPICAAALADDALWTVPAKKG